MTILHSGRSSLLFTIGTWILCAGCAASPTAGPGSTTTGGGAAVSGGGGGLPTGTDGGGAGAAPSGGFSGGGNGGGGAGVPPAPDSGGADAGTGGGAGSVSGAAGDGGGPGLGSCSPASGAAVTLTTDGSGFRVANGLLTVALNGSGLVTQLTKDGQTFMGPTDTMYVSESGGATYYGPDNGDRSPLATGAPSGTLTTKIVRQSDDLVELSFLDTAGGSHDMDWDLHYVFQRGVSGYYYFLVTASGTASHPVAPTLSELRTVQHFSAAVLPNGYNGERHGQLPTEAQAATFSTTTAIQDTTWPLTLAPTTLVGVPTQPGAAGRNFNEGPVYTKYDWASYRTEDLVHGLYGNGHGVWMVSPSWEYYTGGPVKQELMVHQNNLILNMYHGGHFGSAVATPAPANWQKIYGPNLVYVNAGSDDHVISDALAQGAAERSHWPYCWMAHALYPLAAQRGTVTGKVTEADGQSVAGAMVVLAGPGPLVDQGYGYMFWSAADASGNFTITGVRPGSYSVHVYASQGLIVDDPDHGEIVGTAKVVAGQNELGSLRWSPPFHAHLLWSIGVSDQRSGEFRFSPKVAAGDSNVGAAMPRMYGTDASHAVWTVPPANTTYTVGSSEPQTDWYFVQSVNGTWTVSFALTAVPSGGAFLTIGVAGAARTPTLTVSINGARALQHTFGNDQSLYRSALQGGRFEMLTASVPASALKVGTNSATFQMNSNGAGAGIFYDVLKLESD
jgi:rhamnogalacturonan endolyase